MTLLPGVLMAAKHSIFLVTGEDKAQAVKSVIDEPYDPMKYPAQMSMHHGRGVTLFFDAAAASLLE